MRPSVEVRQSVQQRKTKMASPTSNQCADCQNAGLGVRMNTVLGLSVRGNGPICVHSSESVEVGSVQRFELKIFSHYSQLSPFVSLSIGCVRVTSAVVVIDSNTSPQHLRNSLGERIKDINSLSIYLLHFEAHYDIGKILILNICSYSQWDMDTQSLK